MSSDDQDLEVPQLTERSLIRYNVTYDFAKSQNEHLYVYCMMKKELE